MVQFLSSVKVNASFLPPVKSYEMWLNPKAAANYDTGVDPCPDCDVRFHEGQSKPVLADTSILGILSEIVYSPIKQGSMDQNRLAVDHEWPAITNDGHFRSNYKSERSMVSAFIQWQCDIDRITRSHHLWIPSWDRIFLYIGIFWPCWKRWLSS